MIQVSLLSFVNGLDHVSSFQFLIFVKNSLHIPLSLFRCISLRSSSVVESLVHRVCIFEHCCVEPFSSLLPSSDVGEHLLHCALASLTFWLKQS